MTETQLKAEVEHLSTYVSEQSETIYANDKQKDEVKFRGTIENQKQLLNRKKGDIPTPIAIPVLSPEEAIKANQEAISFLSLKKGSAIKDAFSSAETIIEDKPVPVAIPIFTPEEAQKANRKAIRIQRNKAIANAFQSLIHKIYLNNNRIHFILSLFPLLLIFDILLFKKKKRNKVNEYFSLPRRVRILFSVSLLVFGVFIFVPWSVYFGNSPQFPFVFQDFVNWNLRVLTIFIVGGSIVLFLIPPIISDYIVAAIAGLGMCVYVQAMFMNQYLGSMDGVEPKWSEHRIFGIFNLIIWIIIILSPIVLRKHSPSHFSKVISSVTGLVLFLELLATTSMVVSAGPNVWTRVENSYYIDGSKQFQLSKEKNVILFVMDKLSSQYVKQCFESYPETKIVVKDFIWYADACSNYHSTFLGLSQELTGVLYPPPTINHYEMFEKMWHSKSAKSFYKQINNSGYDARFYISQSDSKLGAEDSFYNYFSNIQVRDTLYKIDYNRLHNCLKQMSFFSSAPYFLKKYCFYSFDFFDNIVQKHVLDYPSAAEGCPSNPERFLKKMLSFGVSSDANKPVLAYYYTIGTHDPWYYNEKCHRVEKPFDNPIPTTRCCFYILSEFIRLLKEADIYDNTAILLCSDHGAVDRYDMTFMIKPFRENKTELSIDASLVQSVDVLPTLLKMACGDTADFKDFDGYPSFMIPNERIRKVYETTNRKDIIFDSDKTNALIEYTFIQDQTFRDFLDKKSDYYVRLIPLGKSSQEEN